MTGSFFGATGGRLARLIQPAIRNGELQFTVERTFEGTRARRVRAMTTARRRGEGLEGVTRIDDREYRWTGWRSPIITDRDDGNWQPGAPQDLLRDGLANLDTQAKGRKEDWDLRGGVLRNNTPKADLLVTKSKYWNFHLHIEYRLPADGNSGIGLRHHYELQLFDVTESRPMCMAMDRSTAVCSRVPMPRSPRTSGKLWM